VLKREFAKVLSERNNLKKEVEFFKNAAKIAEEGNCKHN
jgi:hypothetical protein